MEGKPLSCGRNCRQLEKQSKSECPWCHSSEACSTWAGFGISTSVYKVQGYLLTIQSFLLEWSKVSKVALGGKRETMWQDGSGMAIPHHPLTPALFQTRSRNGQACLLAVGRWGSTATTTQFCFEDDCLWLILQSEPLLSSEFIERHEELPIFKVRFWAKQKFQTRTRKPPSKSRTSELLGEAEQATRLESKYPLCILGGFLSYKLTFHPVSFQYLLGLHKHVQKACESLQKSPFFCHLWHLASCLLPAIDQPSQGSPACAAAGPITTPLPETSPGVTF